MCVNQLKEKASTLRAFVDALIPDDRLFPSASVIGLQWVLAEKIRSTLGEGVMDRLINLLNANGRPFYELLPAMQSVVVERLADESPELFQFSYEVLNENYILHPLVSHAIQEHEYPSADYQLSRFLQNEGILA